VAHISELPPGERATALASLPVILEIRKGDSFPVEPVLESALVALHAEGTGCSRPKRPSTPAAGGGASGCERRRVDFDAPGKNSFGIGFDSRQGQPTKVRVAVTWHAAGEHKPSAP
jgi:hypothetical protein